MKEEGVDDSLESTGSLAALLRVPAAGEALTEDGRTLAAALQAPAMAMEKETTEEQFDRYRPPSDWKLERQSGWPATALAWHANALTPWA